MNQPNDEEFVRLLQSLRAMIKHNSDRIKSLSEELLRYDNHILYLKKQFSEIKTNSEEINKFAKIINKTISESMKKKC